MIDLLPSIPPVWGWKRAKAVDIEDGGDGGFIALIKDRLGHKIGVGQGPLALAAANAYLEAMSREI